MTSVYRRAGWVALAILVILLVAGGLAASQARPPSASPTPSSQTSIQSPYADCFGMDNPWRLLPRASARHAATAVLRVNTDSKEDAIDGVLLDRPDVGRGSVRPGSSPGTAGQQAVPIVSGADSTVSWEPQFFASGFTAESLESIRADSGRLLRTWDSSATGGCHFMAGASTITGSELPPGRSILRARFTADGPYDFAWIVDRETAP